MKPRRKFVAPVIQVPKKKRSCKLVLALSILIGVLAFQKIREYYGSSIVEWSGNNGAGTLSSQVSSSGNIQVKDERALKVDQVRKNPIDVKAANQPVASALDRPRGLRAGENERQAAEDHFKKMEKVLTGFLSAESLEEMVKWVRHPERVTPLMKSYYARNQIEPLAFKKTKKYHSISLENKPFIALEVGVEKREEGIPILIEDQQDGMLVDWESYVCYLPMSPEQLAESRPTDLMSLRVYIQRDNFHSYEFSDESEHDCFRLTFRESDTILYGFVKKGTALEQEFVNFFPLETGEYRKPAIIKARFLEGSKATRSMLIEGLESTMWAFPNNPRGLNQKEDGLRVNPARRLYRDSQTTEQEGGESKPYNTSIEKNDHPEKFKPIIAGYRDRLSGAEMSLDSLMNATKELKKISPGLNEKMRGELVYEYIKFRNEFKGSESFDYLDQWDDSTDEGRKKREEAHALVGIDFSYGESYYLDETVGWLETELQDIAGKDWIDFFSIERVGVGFRSDGDWDYGSDYTPYEAYGSYKAPPNYPFYPFQNRGSIEHHQLLVAISKYEEFLLSYPSSSARNFFIEKLEFLYVLLVRGSSRSPIFEMPRAALIALGSQFDEGLATRLKSKVKELKISAGYRKTIEDYLRIADSRWVGFNYVKRLSASLVKSNNLAITVWAEPTLDLTKDLTRNLDAENARKKAATAAAGQRIVSKPSGISQPKPKYPPAARRAGQQGTVTLSFTIGSSGKVISARIAKSSGYILLDNAALSAIRSWRFKPARNVLGDPVSYSYTLPVPFRLE